MRTSPLAAVPAVAALLLLSGCGGDDPVAIDPGGAPTSSSASAPAGVPPADGPVRTRWVVTVMDTGTPELCLGAVAESWPPQCGGPTLAGWDWAEHRGTFERSGSVRWGEYVVQGTFDGTTFTYESAVPAALYDAAVEPSPTAPVAADPPSGAELQRIADRLADELPGLLGTRVEDDHVVADVVNDDGTLQASVDGAYGAGVVLLVPALVPVLE